MNPKTFSKLLIKQRKAQLAQIALLEIEKEMSQLEDALVRISEEYEECLAELPLEWKQLDENGLIITQTEVQHDAEDQRGLEAGDQDEEPVT